MIFVLDTGNTNTVLGVFKDGVLLHEWRIKTDRHKTEDEFGMMIKSLFDFKGIQFTDIKAVIISSVVPPIMDALAEMSIKYFDKEPVIVGKNDFSSYIKMNYPHPTEIGADRIVNAVAGIHLYGAPLIIIDFGTATTYCYVNEKKEYSGGIIAPGINISMDALYQKAAKLPKIEFQAPNQIIGKSTVEAMQSGVYFGYITQIDGMILKIKEEMGNNSKVIATGGYSDLLSKGAKQIDIVDEHLTLKGLHIIYKMKVKDTM